MGYEVLAERYEMLCKSEGVYSDINEHLPTFVEAVKEVDAKKVIELGTRYGVSTIAWLYALKDQGDLWAVDCSFPVASPQYPDTNLLDPQGPLGVMPHWVFLLGYDTQQAILDALPQKVDIVFIDTNHVYEETLVELDLYYQRVRKGGRIFLHDTAIETTGNATAPQPPYPVRTAMQEFCEKNDLKFSNVDNCMGLGTIYC